jgi:hypothetical protein
MKIIKSEFWHILQKHIALRKKITYGQITQNLVATGEIGHIQRGMAARMRSQGLDQAVQVADQGTGAPRSGQLVAGNEANDLQSAWPGWSKYLDCRHEQGKT